jgi:fructokinase
MISTPRIGIDLGGTKIEGVLLGADPVVPLRRVRIPTPRAEGYDAILAAVSGMIFDLLGDAGGVATVGVGIPGTISTTHGRVKNANTTSLIGHPFARDLEKKVGCPVLVENDANCFALAEALQGAGRGARCVFGVILGTGVGGGIVLDRRIWRGAQGIAGEWGHMTLEPGGPGCYCGRRGCVETFLCGPAVARSYEEQSGTVCDASEVWGRAQQGEEAARRVTERYKERLGFALAQVVNVLDPDVIVLGGGVSNAPALAEEILPRLRPHLFNDEIETRILRHELGDSAGVLGASWLGSDPPPQSPGNAPAARLE